ncbi:g6509 [Coccomyxa viridis]|uniref:G6509 protein n=1 Tax=Coccomyxa viridis TaxID=1274662 RepID=A0ABP1FY19_9CHLO
MPLSSIAQTDDDAWDDDEVSGGHRRKTIVKPDYVSGHVVSAVKRFNKLYASQLQPRLGRKLPSLQALSLGCLARYISDVLEIEQEFLASLPWAWKAPLLAVARRKGLLNDDTLWKLSDSEADVLDISRSPDLTHEGILRGLQAMPHVRHLDLTDCTYFPTLLASLPELCPQLESLRLGGFKLTLRRRHRLRTEQEAVKALLQSLPRISHARVQDCWEDEEQPESSPALHKLRMLGWPELDPQNQDILRKAAPWLRIITIEDDQESETLEEALAKEDAGLRVLAEALDHEYAAMCHFDWEEGGASLQATSEQHAASSRPAAPGSLTSSTMQGPSMAERFRAAYESRAARVAIVRERNAKKERRREIRAMGSAERALHLAEQGVPLVSRVNVKKTR